jgi:hypothetical protein
MIKVGIKVKNNKYLGMKGVLHLIKVMLVDGIPVDSLLLLVASLKY